MLLFLVCWGSLSWKGVGCCQTFSSVSLRWCVFFFCSINKVYWIFLTYKKMSYLVFLGYSAGFNLLFSWLCSCVILVYRLIIFYHLYSVCFFFKTGSYYVAQAGLQFTILMPQPPKCQDYKSALPHYNVQFFDQRNTAIIFQINL
jgi:hypothetical protein